MAESSGVRVLAGGCHCRRVRFEATFRGALQALDCNCSICAATAYLHLIVDEVDFRLIAGSDALTGYRFNTGSALHLFCRYCGIKSFYRPRSHPEGFSVNARCLDAGAGVVDSVVPFDGRNWEQARERLPD